MLLENPSSGFIPFTIVFCLAVALINGVLAWVRPKISRFSAHPKLPLFAWLNCAIFFVLAIYYIHMSMTSYTALQLSKDAKSNTEASVTAIFAFIRGPVKIDKDQIKSILVEKEWTSRKRGPENWYEVIVETKDGASIRPNWSISEKISDEYNNLARFVQEMQSQNLPLSFSYKDKQGKTHLTQSITDRPE